ncbi:phage tail protein [Natranaeroarchaeum aerophilus]|uniref:Phage tail protein n=1 Tax=Natranaeroarchaeum aerophilus TaxID=2917711 RepID=A0AAE3K5T0_9EURY|nr:phage tail protein [Natranaeroarchaeum aerophilus]MCL9812039.1 phage tail protein [Natranaeroarchaeum aerophilus]
MSEHGPLGSTEFKVELDGVDVPGFLEVKLPSQEVDEYDYREGDDTKHNRKLFGDVHYSPLQLARGADEKNEQLDNWHKAVKEGDEEEARKEIAVVLKDMSGESKLRYEFSNAWIREYEAPTLNAQAGGGAEAIAVETYTVEFEEMERKSV